MKRFLGFCVFFFVLVGMLSVSAAQNVVSLHKGYTLLTKASEGYPDEAENLTNGRYGTPTAMGEDSFYYRDEEYVGFRTKDGEDIAILLDLGEVYKELWTFEVGYLREEEAGIQAPASIAFYISDTEEGEYALLGVLSPAAEGKASVASLEAAEAKSGRYVKIVITPRENAAWTFLDEITVLQGRNPLADPFEESSVEQERSSLPPDSETAVPDTGDGDITLFVMLCGVSAIGTAALIGRKRFV